MNTCRICLSNETSRYVSELETKVNEHNNDCQDVMMFCLGIQVNENSKISTRLCLKCYKKVLMFHRFKVLALKNDAYLKSISENTSYETKFENYFEVIKAEEGSVNGSDLVDNAEDTYEEIKNELEVKDENASKDLDSDNELLSVIKKLKNENLSEESAEENAPIKKKRGRPKSKMKRTEKKIQICDTCGKPVKNLRDHLKTHSTDLKPVSCKKCNKTFKSKSSRYKHNKVKHLGFKHHCEICGKDVISIKQHTLIAHNRDALPYSCFICERRFLTAAAKELHVGSHSKNRPFECEVCLNRYRTKFALNQHKRQVHDKEKTHLCQFCSKSFFKKYHLQVHIRTHTKEKPCKCPECGKCFITTSVLRNHLLVHSTVKAHACVECGVAFSRLGYLRNHMISHTKEKRYPCRYCSVRFGRSDHRKRHEYTAHQKQVHPDT